MEKELPKKKKLNRVRLAPLIKKNNIPKEYSEKTGEKTFSKRVFTSEEKCTVVYPCGIESEAYIIRNPGSVLLEPTIPNTAFFIIHNYDLKEDHMISLQNIPFTRIVHTDVNIKILKQAFS